MDYYEVLHVPRNFTDEELKKSYRQLALQWHPDRNPGNVDAETNFKRIAEAYQTLSDPEKRTAYDLKQPARVSESAAQPKKPKTKEDFEREFAEAESYLKHNATHDELQHIECSYFGGGNTGRNILVQLKLTPEEMRNGCSKLIKIKKRDLCSRCAGDGTGHAICPKCRNATFERSWCERCDREGVIQIKCQICKGEGVSHWIVQGVKVVVSPRVQSGHVINIMGEGECAPRKPPGNLRVVIV